MEESKGERILSHINTTDDMCDCHCHKMFDTVIECADCDCTRCKPA